MRTSSFFLIVVAALAGCNGSTRPGYRPRTAEVRPRDPAFEAMLKNMEEPSGFKHVMKKGDTLYALGRKYGVPVAAISAANPGLDPRSISIGAAVIIPGVKAPGGDEPETEPSPKPPRVRTPHRGQLRYPAAARYSSIGGGSPSAEFSSTLEDTVVAAADGTVVVATPELGGLGPTVMVDHGGGLVTMYGRLLDYAVRSGEKLKRGDPLGRSGATGILFRVYSGSVPKAPASYLK